MENTFISIEELKKRYPDEWVLLGDPEFKTLLFWEGWFYITVRTKKRLVISDVIKLLVIRL